MLRTDAVPFDQFASETGYNDLDDNIDDQRDRRRQLRNHYLTFNAAEFAAQNNERVSEVRRQFGASIDEYDFNLRQQRQTLQIQNPAPEALPEDTRLTFNPEEQTTAEAYGNALAQGFSTGFSETLSGLGIIGNTIARQFNDESDFGLGLTEYGQNLTNQFRDTFAVTAENSFGLEVAQGVGQFISLFATGGVGGAAARGGARLLTKGAASAATGRIASTVGTSTGAFSSAVAPQVTELIDRYIADQPEGAQFDQETINQLVASGVLIGAIDSIVPGRILSQRGVFKNVADKAIANRAVRRGSGVVGRATETAVLEGATEGLQAIAADIVAEMTIRDSTFGEGVEAALNDISNTGREAGVGGGTGFVIGLLSTLLPGRNGVRGIGTPEQNTSGATTTQVTPPTIAAPAPNPVDTVDTRSYQFEGRNYTIVEDTLSDDGTTGTLIAEVELDDGRTQRFETNSSFEQSAQFIQEHLRQRSIPIESVPVQQPEVFSYDADPLTPDQAVVEPDEADIQQVATPQDGDGRAAELRERLADFRLNQQTLTPQSRLTSIRRAVTRELASGGELKNQSAKSALIRDIYVNHPQEGVLRSAELYEAGNRIADVEVREPIFEFQQALRQDFPNFNTAELRNMHNALRGNGEAIQNLPDSTRNVILQMRDQINGQSAQITVELESVVNRMAARQANTQARLGDNHPDTQRLTRSVNQIRSQLEAIQANLPSENNPVGSYIHRSYGIYVDAEYRNRVFNESSTEYQEFATYLAGEHITRNRGLTNEQAQAQAQSDIAQLQRTVNDFADQRGLNNDAAILSSISALRQRRRVPPQVRQFLGEIQDPAVNFAATIHQQRVILSSIEMANNIESQGVSQGWLREEPNPSNGAIIPFEGNNNNPGLIMLNGLYGPDYIVSGLNDYFAIPNLNQGMKILNSVLGYVKMGKTIGSVGTQVRNFTSAIWSLGVNGSLLNGRGIAQSTAIVREQLQGRKGSEYHKTLVGLGVLSDGASTGTLRQIANDINSLDQFGLFDESIDSRQLVEGPGIFRRITNAARKAYQASDDFPKVVGFETNRDLLARARGLDRNDPRIMEEAAQRVRDTYFTYSKVANIIKRFRSVPFGPPFISFPAEVYRTSKNFLNYVAQDLQSGNPVLQRSAGLRLVSAAATFGVSYNFAQILGQLALGDDPQEEREKELMREFLKNGRFTDGNDLQVTRKMEDGNYEVVNMSRYNPYAGITDVIGNFINGDADLDERLLKATYEIASPFISPDVTLDVVNQALGERERTAGSDTDKTVAFLKEVGKGVLPTTVNEVARVIKAANGDLLHVDQSEVGVGRATARALGATTDVVNPLAVMQFKARALNDQIALANNAVRFSITGRNQPELNPVVLNNQLREVDKEWGRNLRAINILGQLGFDTSEGGQVFKSLIGGKLGAGGPLSKELATALIRGEPFPGIKAPARSVENNTRRTRFFRGDDAAQEAQRQAVEKFRRLREGL